MHAAPMGAQHEDPRRLSAQGFCVCVSMYCILRGKIDGFDLIMCGFKSTCSILNKNLI